MAAAGSLPESRAILPTNAVPNLRPSRLRSERVSTSACLEASQRPATPWWLWWNILSADAPVVALIWAALFADASGVRLSPSEATALVLAVWVIYVSDRLLDGWTAENLAALQERHLFSKSHPFVLASLVAVAGLAILWLTLNRLPAVEVLAGIKLGAILVAYMASIHIGRSRLARALPKEIAVGVLFAAGATLPFWSRSARFPWPALLPWVLFALLCSLNCLCIECWENRPYPGFSGAPLHRFVQWADPHINRFAAGLALAACIAVLATVPGGSSPSGLIAICLGSLAILLLNCWRSRLSPAALRVLADAALAIPPLGAILIRR